jgi:glycogen debranching enzyme
MIEPCFFLSNERGSYFCSSKNDFSSYQGWFVFFEDNWDLFKIVDKVQGDFNCALGNRSLFLASDFEQDVIIDLDFRFVHDFDDRGRIYDVYMRDDFVIVKYTKFLNSDLFDVAFTKYLAIKGLSSISFIKSWIHKFYSYDSSRGALSDLHVFRLLECKAQNISFGFGSSEEDAIVSACVVPSFKKEVTVSFDEGAQKKLVNEFKDALISADLAFSSCVKFNNLDEPLIFAGYPWFFQVWARDECISLVGLLNQGKFDLAKKIILRNLKSMSGGVLPNRYPESSLASADSTGWLFQRIFLFLKMSKDVVFSSSDLSFIEQKLDSFLNHCKSHSHKGLVFNGPKETWMDTVDSNSVDTRSGARVEIQALYLSALSLKIYLRNLAGDLSSASKFRHVLAKKKTLIKNQLMKSSILHDGLCDSILDTVRRPNVFLAYYAYPSFLTKSEWIHTFDYVLDDCWLEWGGVSSIGRSHFLFRDSYSGMNNESYHRGDSWFFINNIAGIVLFDLDSNKYLDKIKRLRFASIRELLHSGFIGYSAEVSSASVLESCGCLNQAWSSATLLEFLIKTKKL